MLPEPEQPSLPTGPAVAPMPSDRQRSRPAGWRPALLETSRLRPCKARKCGGARRAAVPRDDRRGAIYPGGSSARHWTLVPVAGTARRLLIPMPVEQRHGRHLRGVETMRPIDRELNPGLGGRASDPTSTPARATSRSGDMVASPGLCDPRVRVRSGRRGRLGHAPRAHAAEKFQEEDLRMFLEAGRDTLNAEGPPKTVDGRTKRTRPAEASS